MSKLQVEQILALLDKEADAQGVPRDAVRKIFGAENFKDGKVVSGYQVPTNLVSPKGATGLMQVMPATAEGLKKQGRIPADTDITTPEGSIRAGVAALKEARERYPGNDAAAFAHYNGGFAQSKAVAAGMAPPAAETQRYLKNTGSSVQTSAVQNVSYKMPATNPGAPFDPAASAADLMKFISGQEEIMTQVGEAVKNKEQHQYAIADAAKEAAKAKGDAAQARGDAEVIQNKHARTITELLTGGQNPEGTLLQNQVQIEMLRKKQTELRAQIDPVDNVNPLENPLQWIVNQFTMPQLKQEYNAAAIQEMTLQQQTAADIAKAKALQEILPADIATQVKQRVVAERAAAQAEAAVQAAQAMAATQNDATNYAYHRLQVNQATYNEKQQLANKLAEQFRWNDAFQARNKEEKEIEQVLNLVNMRRIAYGASALTPGVWKSLAPQTRADMALDASKTAAGQSPGEVLRWHIDNGTLNTMGESRPAEYRYLISQLQKPSMKQALEQYRSTPANAKEMQKLDPLQQQAKVFDLVIKSEQEAMQMDKKTGRRSQDHGTIPEDHHAYVKLEDGIFSQNLKANIFTESVKELSAQNKGKAVKPTDIWRAAVAKATVDKAKIPEIAKQLSEFITTTQKEQWERAPAQLGIPKPVEFVFAVDDVDTHRTINAWSAAQLEHGLTKAAAEYARKLPAQKLPPGTTLFDLAQKDYPGIFGGSK